MDAALQAIIEVLKSNGLAGVVIGLALFANYKQYLFGREDQLAFSKVLQDTIKEYSTVTAANTASNRDLEKSIYAQIAAYKEMSKA